MAKRNTGRVYLAAMEELGCFGGMSTSRMVLLRGNEVLEVDGVVDVEHDANSLEDAWRDNLEMLTLGEEGVTLRAVEASEADALWRKRLA